MLRHAHPRSRPPNRVIVLGSRGFVGHSLVGALRRDKVDVLPLTSTDLDLTDPYAGHYLSGLLRPTDSIVFLAAVTPGSRHDEQAFMANIVMASAVCQAVRQRGCQHIVYISSDAVYPFTSEPIREDTPVGDKSLYALMHRAREAMLDELRSVPVAILRLTQVYGFGDTHNAYGPNRMIRSAVSDGRVVLFGSGEETRDHIHVQDVARLMSGVLNMGSDGIANVASGRSISFASLAQIVVDICGDGVSIDQQARRMPVYHRHFDVGALQTAFPDWMQIPLEAGIQEMIDQERRRLARRAEPGVARP